VAALVGICPEEFLYYSNREYSGALLFLVRSSYILIHPELTAIKLMQWHSLYLSSYLMHILASDNLSYREQNRKHKEHV